MKLVDALGKPCPMPVVLAKKELDGGAAELTVLVDNAAAVENLKRLGSGRGLSVTAGGEPGRFTVVLAGEGIVPRPEVVPARAAAGCGEAVLVAKDHLGEGDEALGKSLLKMFLYTLAQGDALPASLIFLNGGVKLPAGEEEDVLQSLRELEDKGCEVLVCGTCLNYYGLSEKLRIGAVSNMYDILEALRAAGKIITV